MRALSSSTAVSVLLLSLAAVTSSPQSGDQPGVYEDQCEYKRGDYKCGDKCLYGWYECDCGGHILSYEQVPTLHCCSAAPCTQTGSDGDVKCNAGEVLDINTPCHGKCYADIAAASILNITRLDTAVQEEMMNASQCQPCARAGAAPRYAITKLSDVTRLTVQR